MKQLWSSLNLILVPHILPTLVNETIGKYTGDYHPVFYNALQNTAHRPK